MDRCLGVLCLRSSTFRGLVVFWGGILLSFPFLALECTSRDWNLGVVDPFIETSVNAFRHDTELIYER